MRTTLSIDDVLLDRVKDRARLEGSTAGRVVEEALRHYLARPATTPEAFSLPVFGGQGGLREGIDPSSNASLREAAGDPDREAAGLL